MQKKLNKIIFTAYIFAVLWLTLIDRTPTYHRMMLMPFWEYRNLLFSGNHLYWFQQIGCNILMLMPLGFLLAMRKISTRNIVIIGCLFSVFIELTQLITARGLCEFDDVFNNTLGAWIGCAIYRMDIFRRD
ncbi:MAG: VanZ family protein [Lachnospiraceae bacterium]|nr:VanZ family protein [Lachnospiraceae bacterium]